MAPFKKSAGAVGKGQKRSLSDTTLLLAITIIVFFLMYVGAMIFQGGGFLKAQTFFNILNTNAGAPYYLLRTEPCYDHRRD